MTAITSLLVTSLLTVPVPAGLAPPVPAGLAAAAPVTWTTANSVASGDQDVPAIAANRNGRVAVVWEDDRDTTARRTTRTPRSTCGSSTTAPRCTS